MECAVLTVAARRFHLFRPLQRKRAPQYRGGKTFHRAATIRRRPGRHSLLPTATHELLERLRVENVTYTTEFYNTSECRDLLFHVQEHRTTLPEIKVELAAHDLRFIGFESDAWTRQQYAARFPADKTMTDLDRWHELELDNPLTFVGMYQFWAQRI